MKDFPGGAGGKEPACQCRRCKRCGFDPWVGKMPWSRKWQPTAVFLPRKFHGQRSLVGLQTMGLQRVGHKWATKHYIMNIWKLHRTQELEIALPANQHYEQRDSWSRRTQHYSTCQAVDVFSFIIGQGALAHLVFLVPFWKHIIWDCIKGITGLMLYVVLKALWKHLQASHWIAGPWALPGMIPSALDSWGKSFVCIKPHRRHQSWSTGKCSHREPHVSPVLILTPESSQLCLKFPRSFGVLGASEEEGANRK